MISASGVLNVLPRRQRIKTGIANAGRRAHVWADEHSVHVLIEGHHDRTVPSNLTDADLLELRLRGAQPTGPPSAARAVASASAPHPGAVIEIDRAVDSSGNVTLGPVKLKLGSALARRTVTLGIDGHLIHVIADAALAKTLPAPTNLNHTRLRGVRLATILSRRHQQDQSRSNAESAKTAPSWSLANRCASGGPVPGNM